MREFTRAWRVNNPEKNKEMSRAYFKKHPEIRRATEAKRRYALRSLSEDNYTVSQVRNLMVAQSYRCANVFCGINIRDSYHVDHILAVSLGGSNGIDNIQLLCPTCNMKKHIKYPHEWRRSQIEEHLL